MEKIVFWSCLTIGSLVGTYIPGIWHAGAFSASGIIGGLMGAIAGFWVFKLLENYIES